MTALPGMDVAALRSFLIANDVEVIGEFKVEQISGGRSNLTFLASDDRSQWVVRRPPTAGLTPSAHDMAREWAVTDALQSTPIPVAPTIAFDRDGLAVGAPLTVVGYVPGRVLRTADDLVALSEDDLDRNVDGLLDVLVALHDVEHVAVGLADFGRPEGFVERQVRTWSRQWERVKTRDLPDVERLCAALANRVPATSAAAIVHGDYRVDNTILANDDPGRIAAVVDWEMATLGDPLTDVALMCAYRRPAFNLVLGIPAAWTSVRYPTADDLAQRYAIRSGRDLGDWGFYMGLANLKLGIIGEGIAHRALSGAGSPDGERAALATQEFVSAGLEALAGGRA